MKVSKSVFATFLLMKIEQKILNSDVRVFDVRDIPLIIKIFP